MTRPVSIIGVPTDYGVDRRGVDMGPSAIRYAGLQSELTNAGIPSHDTGNLAVPPISDHERGHGTAQQTARFLEETRDVCETLADTVASTIADGNLPLVIGGDHSIAIGTINGAAANASIGVVWFDAHGDFNTPETTPSGNIHGMPLAAILGRGQFAEKDWAVAPGVSESNVVWIGLRSLDPEERDAINASAATAFSMSDIDDQGITSVMNTALDIAMDGVDGIHVSLDLDFLDPDEAPGVGTPVRGGVTYREAHSALETVANRTGDTSALRSLELVEVNPILDTHNRTAELATELAASALGKRIL